MRLEMSAARQEEIWLLRSNTAQALAGADGGQCVYRADSRRLKMRIIRKAAAHSVACQAAIGNTRRDNAIADCDFFVETAHCLTEAATTLVQSSRRKRRVGFLLMPLMTTVLIGTLQHLGRQKVSARTGKR